ncbi:sll1863 family stress response protein [Flavobacterium psychrotolerans]|uniref:Lipoprotein n=1 Tax=Flavobacterium psychrotolerans TaxID=2169410 RepID=A0A2U1JI10_9FLAO|nr:hypothetical protein [Flavobacterium psychrotolerans]PWA04786.1 hypothetical protein DB895_09885 [Flavobacterium psychrotolerans]
MKKTIVTFSFLAFTTFTFLTSCKNNETKIEDAQENVLDAKKDLVEAKQDSLSDYESFKTKINEKIAANEVKITDLKIKAIDGSKAAKAKYNEAVVALEEKNIELKTKINTYSESSKEAWEVFKKDMNKTADDLEKEFDEFKSKNK